MAWFNVVRKRPWTALSLAGGTGTVALAGLVEVQAERRERAHLADPHHSSPALTLPRQYDWEAVNAYWSVRPITTVKRCAQIGIELGPLAALYVKDFVLHQPSVEKSRELQTWHAEQLRERLTNLGPAFVKAGQQLSIRPDLVPPPVLKELQRLCDAVRPIPDQVALQLIRDELNQPDLPLIFEDMKLVASASLGQVYKAKCVKTGEHVAVKVQRPDMLRSFSLDLFLLQRIGVLVDAFTTIFTNQPPFHKSLYESFSRGSYSELDYENEAQNQIKFKRELEERKVPVVVPRVYSEYTSQRVLTSQWIDGIKLADAPKDQIRQLIPIGVELFLTQLLDIGGNLLVTKDGHLCLLDFGLCAEVDVRARNAMTKAIVHLLARDFDTLVSQDAKELGFLPEDYDTTELKPLMTKILTVGLVDAGSSDLRKRKRKLMEISNELNEVFFNYPFQVPPFFALVTRGLGLLEGIALTGDPDFDIFQASVPYARRRAMAMVGSGTFRYMTGGRETLSANARVD